MLIGAAAGRWEVDPASCVARAGRVHHEASDRNAGYGELVDDAAELELPLRELFIRNPYIPRTFQIAGQANREDLVRLKFTVMRSLLTARRRFVLVDDSLVRSTTQRILVTMIREAAVECGVNPDDVEVHVRIASPPITGCCYYGIDTPETTELAASNHSIEEITKMIGSTSLAYVSIEGLDTVTAQYDKPSDFCHACFTGKYPTPYQTRTR